MVYSKQRFEFFSDGLMAIIMTIMVIDIHVTSPFILKDVDDLLESILIYFVSFFIVGWFLNRHHYLISNTKKITQRIFWQNLVFLFFVALIPIFTKLIIENNADNIAIISYDIVFLLANILFYVMEKETRKQISKEKIEKIKAIRTEMMKQKHSRLKIASGSIVLTGLTVLSIFFPQFSIIMFIVFPIVSLMMNISIKYDRDISIMETAEE